VQPLIHITKKWQAVIMSFIQIKTIGWEYKNQHRAAYFKKAKRLTSSLL
jgi:hypothetical protein